MRMHDAGAKITSFIVAIALVPGMALASAAVSVATPGVDASQPWGDHVIAPDVRVVRQTLTAEHNGLTAVSLRVAIVSPR